MYRMSGMRQRTPKAKQQWAPFPHVQRNLGSTERCQTVTLLPLTGIKKQAKCEHEPGGSGLLKAHMKLPSFSDVQKLIASLQKLIATMQSNPFGAAVCLSLVSVAGMATVTVTALRQIH